MFSYEDGYSVPISNINSYKVIIDDNDCSDVMFREICSYLSDQELQFVISRGGKDINYDNSIVVTIDQQYSSGDETKIFAPCDNTRGGYSDALALAMKASLEREYIRTDDIVCGKHGYHQDDDGVIHKYSLTETEKKISKINDSSFITVSLGTQCANAKEVAVAIKNGIARFIHYINSHSNAIDLIYRCNESDTLENIANYFNVTTSELVSNNHIKTNHFFDAQAIVNPGARNVDSFNPDINFSIDLTSSKQM